MARRSAAEINLAGRFKQSVLSGRARFLLLIAAFNLLLIATLLLAMQRHELQQEVEIVRQTRVVIEGQVRTFVVTQTQVVTKIMPYGWTPGPAP